MVRILVVDTETAGLDPRHHSLLSVGLVCGDLDSGAIVAQEEILVRWEQYTVDAAAMKVNGIDLAAHHEAASDAYLARAALKRFVADNFPEGPPTPCGHNYPFDRDFIKYGICHDFDTEVVKRRFVDTSSMLVWLGLQGRIPVGMGLTGALKHFGVGDGAGRHTALADARDTFGLLMRIDALLKGTTTP